MNVLIDACVLYPTVLRHLVIGAAQVDLFRPQWSARILEEWARAAGRDGFESDARAEIAHLRSRFPASEILPDPSVEASLTLPDPNDTHVLAAAIAAGADELMTLNTKDFPTRTLARHGIIRRHPDEFLLEAWHAVGDFRSVVFDVHARAQSDGINIPVRGFLKKSRLPRLAKAVAEVDP